jgi:hypothetical protein
MARRTRHCNVSGHKKEASASSWSALTNSRRKGRRGHGSSSGAQAAAQQGHQGGGGGATTRWRERSGRWWTGWQRTLWRDARGRGQGSGRGPQVGVKRPTYSCLQKIQFRGGNGVGSSHIEGGVEYGTCFQALKEKTKTLTYQLVLPILKRFFSTSRAH